MEAFDQSAYLRGAEPIRAGGSPYDGVMMNYINPVTGGPVMQTIGATMQMLRPGERTKAHRHNGSFVYQCCKGHGYSVIGGKRFEWRERDIFCVPSWMWPRACQPVPNGRCLPLHVQRPTGPASAWPLP